MEVAAGDGREHDVFLSFHGGDTRNGFTDHLYMALVSAGVRAFRDSEKLHFGEEIGPQLIKGIEQSKISIPVFSMNYASSKWCLKEFAVMMDSWKDLNQTVLPIFYGVTPNDVQHQTGPFHKSFAEHPEKYDPDTIQQWRDALSRVGSLKGWDVAKMFNGSEATIVRDVVEKVTERLKTGHICVEDNLVGMEEHKSEVMELLDIGVQDVRTVGIWGMGGVGKSALANVMYNQIVDQFECRGFVHNIQEYKSQTNGIEVLLGILVSKLSMSEFRAFATASDGKNELRTRFCGKKVLILLDGVDEKDQFKALGVTEHSWINSLGKGSRIIVTTRNSSILDGSRDKIYQLKEMKPRHALQLFCNHAFKADFPAFVLKDLSSDIVRTAGGLPLVLKALGSSLHNIEDRKIWEDTLKSLKLQSIPDKEVEELLRIDLEALTNPQKHVFSDIACFLIGVDKRLASCMWNDPGFSPERVLVELCSKSLIRINSDYTIWMHQLLRDLLREIIKKDFNVPGNPIRLWRSEEAMDLLKKQQELPYVEAICLDGADVTKPFKAEVFKVLPKLKFLKIEAADLAGNFQEVLTKLRWLSWIQAPFKQTKIMLMPKCLVVLNLSGSMVEDNWFDSSMQDAPELKVLDLSRCRELTKTPDVSVFPKLERLILKGCKNLKSINLSVGKLEYLVYLNLEDCYSVEELPDRMSLSLTELIIDHSGIAVFQISICELKKVERVSLRYSRIKELPDSIRRLKSLVELNLEGAPMENFPSSIRSLQKLKVLKMSSSGIIRLPDTIGSLSQLQVLDLKGCHHLVALPRLPPSLVSLDLTCKSKLPIPNLPDLVNLEALSFNSCEQMAEIPKDIMQLRKLKKLVIEKCVNLHSIFGLPINLCQLYIQGCSKLTEIQGIEDLVSLTTLSVKSIGSASCSLRLPDLSKLKTLYTIRIENCNLVKIQGFGSLCCLTELTMISCPSLETLPDLSELRSLKRLVLRKSEKLQKLEGLQKLDVLAEFDMSGCCAIKKLPNLSNLKLLTALDSSCCVNLEDLGGLVGLTSLKKLDISNCGAIKKLPDLSRMELLEVLNVSGCVEITELPNLSNLKLLRVLEAEGCTKLQHLDGLGELEFLMDLGIQYCKSIDRLPNLSKLQSLKNLQAEGCEKLESLDGLDELDSLVTLNISYCKEIQQLPDLSGLNSLEEVVAQGRDMLNYRFLDLKTEGTGNR